MLITFLIVLLLYYSVVARIVACRGFSDYRFLRNLDFEESRIPIKVVVGVDKPSPLLSQLFKHLI